MKFAVVTPTYNASRHLAPTVESIISQDGLQVGRHTLEYVIRDGASTDRTVSIARRFESLGVSVYSEPDNGMYDALHRGLSQVEGAVYFYLNAGDLLQPNAFNLVAEAVSRGANWLTGMDVYYDNAGNIVNARRPLRYRRKYLRKCYYGRTLLPAVQQESTFWTADLMRLVDLQELSTYRLAGDAFLWHTFAHSADLAIVDYALAGFKYHGEHLSSQATVYAAECERFAGKIGWSDRALALAERTLWDLPPRFTDRQARSGRLPN
ncbi:glycosyltransferase [Nocardioides sp.]|uniref:glycosyltransferase n=1 Tax=Nocardioides sp. TaxID=35761 RepID=UPI0027169336|nr:glycosyltransferase [Nocardioides sp.]MDO9454945.1 glycosyltransferase [Nocardioides sp.]